jgi:hypothetical protein
MEQESVQIPSNGQPAWDTAEDRATPHSPGAMPGRPSPQPSPTSGRNVGGVLELLRPGSFVKLRHQPADLPPFQLIQCRGGRCWVRQQAWGPQVQWEVAHTHLTAAA